MKFAPAIPNHRDILGEGPYWDGDTGRLYWVDINPGLARCLDTATGKVQSWAMGEPIGAVVPRRRGGLVVALRSGLAFLDPATGGLTPFVAPEAASLGNRANESRVDPTGRFWLGTMQNEIAVDGSDIPMTRSSGNLHRIEPDGRHQQVETGIGVANTLAWDTERKRLYFGDSIAKAIWAYDWDPASGDLANRRVFAATEGHGEPDGSGLDAEGCLWNARWGAGCIIRYRPDGTIDRIIPVPAKQPTSCVFGGPGLRTLYVTTASIGLTGDPAAKDRLDGALLVADPGVAGQPCTPFAG